ncbi:nucleotidyltransferase family protein [Phaeodactylibacter luteus]|nr:nucleotidyltransferase family protein [Phaeodactylibacter luteus]
MNDTLIHYRLIAALLNPAEDGAKAAQLLKGNDFHWERLVYIGSNQLVIPALYLQIQRKGLLSYFPDDLLAYMEEITRANRERNLIILDQMQRLSACFTAHEVVHVFLKGAAMLGGGFYTDPAERMLRDIDILIAPKDQQRAYALLKKQGYEEVLAGGLQYKTFADYIKAKHLPAICHPDEVATVELHNYLHNTFQRERLKTERVIGNRVNGGIALPAPEDLLRHNIYNWHINDFGGVKLEVHFRSAYDTLLLLSIEPGLNNVLEETPAARQYSALLSVFFDSLPGGKSGWRQRIMVFKLQHPKVDLAWHTLVYGSVRFWQLLPDRMHLFFREGGYRRRVLEVLKRSEMK